MMMMTMRVQCILSVTVIKKTAKASRTCLEGSKCPSVDLEGPGRYRCAAAPHWPATYTSHHLRKHRTHDDFLYYKATTITPGGGRDLSTPHSC
ncbi:hypothetical protein EVAR_62390_1 [Eumeta japonica]|uniref:Uncharacterized protein n=1 Tax=Eumeta variegata TaxID=151549 RepID=A0A4C1Z020_EUMVA|nr:hypothetical protein EVAR_62390_1 [Eumeta japonica]